MRCGDRGGSDEDDEKANTPAMTAFGTAAKSGKGSFALKPFASEYRLIGKEKKLSAAFEDVPYIRDGFWEHTLDLKR